MAYNLKINDVSAVSLGSVEKTISRLESALWHVQAAEKQLGNTHGAFALFDCSCKLTKEIKEYISAVKGMQK